MYELVAEVSQETVSRLRALVDERAKWKDVVGEGVFFRTWHGVKGHLRQITELKELWAEDTWREAFFLRIPPGGNVHRHVDADKSFETFHVPIETTPEAISFMHPDTRDVPYHLDVGFAYRVNRSVEHSSINPGSGNRTHLLMEIDG